MATKASSFYLTYVLQLQDDCWYVGVTKDLNSRISSHFSGKGSKWTQLHKPISIHQVVIGNCEKQLTEHYRSIKGKALVRGYCWSAVNDPDYQTYPDTIIMNDQVSEVLNLFGITA